ncbi:MAG: Spy/CpxP family protein refolding chaperone [Geitlerinemataceae cyanobacterium]
MKRFFQIGLVSLAATAAAIAAPFVTRSASAQGFPLLDEIDLTAEQREQVEAISEDLRGDVAEILTDDQEAQLRAAIEEGQNPRRAMRSIDSVTDEQKEELRAAMQESRGEIREILTDEQREELRELMEERRRERGERGRGRR